MQTSEHGEDAAEDVLEYSRHGDDMRFDEGDAFSVAEGARLSRSLALP